MANAIKGEEEGTDEVKESIANRQEDATAILRIHHHSINITFRKYESLSNKFEEVMSRLRSKDIIDEKI